MNEPVKVFCLVTSVLLALAGCSKEPGKSDVSSLVTTTTLLGEIAGSAAAGGALTSQPAANMMRNVSQAEFNNTGRGLFYLAEDAGKFRVVHNGKAGTPYTNILTPTLSPDGQRIAYQAYVGDKLRMVVDGREGEVVDELEIPFFSPDNQHLVYQAKSGGRWHFVVDGRDFPGFLTQHNQIGFSADSAQIAYVDRVDERGKPRLVVSDLDFKRQIVKESTGAIMVISADKTRIAATCEVGNKQRVVELSFAKPDTVKEGLLYDAVKNLAISADGSSVAYLAEKDGARVLVHNGKEKPFPAGLLVGSLVLRPDNKGVGFLTASKAGSALHQLFFNDGVQENNYDEVGELAYNSDGSGYVYLGRKEAAGSKGRSIFVVVNGKEGPRFDKIIKPVFSPDGRRVIYRVRQDGKRFVVVSDLDAKVIRRHPDYELVFPPVFTADGKLVAYGVKDGNKLIWKVEKL